MRAMTTFLLLCASNIFMTFAWYGHLKFLHDKPLWVTILLSWGIGRTRWGAQSRLVKLGHLAGRGDVPF